MYIQAIVVSLARYLDANCCLLVLTYMKTDYLSYHFQCRVETKVVFKVMCEVGSQTNGNRPISRKRHKIGHCYKGRLTENCMWSIEKHHCLMTIILV